MKRNKGFTLIELLVVIAIIGILSAIVLASLSTARNKAKDASATGSMSELRAQAEIFYSGTGANSYSSLSSDGQIGRLLTAVASSTNQASFPLSGKSAISSDANTWAAVTVLNTSTNWFCVDSNGDAKTYSQGAIPSIGSGPYICP